MTLNFIFNTVSNKVHFVLTSKVVENVHIFVVYDSIREILYMPLLAKPCICYFYLYTLLVVIFLSVKNNYEIFCYMLSITMPYVLIIFTRQPVIFKEGYVQLDCCLARFDQWLEFRK
jgi:hypothetical protein